MTELPDLWGGSLRRALREVAADPALVERALAAARARLAAAEGPARLGLLVCAGNALRLLGRHDGAVAAQEQALALGAELGDEPAALVARIRLGEARRFADELDAAEAVLREALELARRRPEHGLADFALQHLGKCLLDGGRPKEAEEALREALALRQAKDDEELVASTRLALEQARKTLTQ